MLNVVLTDEEMARHLIERGWIVRRKEEASSTLSFHHTEPVPQNWREMAVQKIRDQVTADRIEFTTGQNFDGPRIHSAKLRLL